MNLLMGCTLISALLYSAATHANDWTYRVRMDSFENVEVRTASIRGQRAGEGFQIIHNSKGEKAAAFSNLVSFDCFPQCTVRIKFDDAAPVEFEATAPRVLSPHIAIKDYQRLESMVMSSNRMILRAAHRGHANDITVDLPTKFDPTQWDLARERQAKEERCKSAAVTEDYSSCMARR